MKNIFSAVASVAVILSASAAFADTNTIYVTQIGNSQVSEATQTFWNNNAIVQQQGDFNQSNLLQAGTFNTLDVNQGNYVTGSTANGLVITQQAGDSNVGFVRQTGLQNTNVISQNGSGNYALVMTNENFSFNQVIQQGVGNSATSVQGLQ